MHANVQTRFNPATGDMAPYYRIKESYRDVQGHVHLLILLNIGLPRNCYFHRTFLVFPMFSVSYKFYSF